MRREFAHATRRLVHAADGVAALRENRHSCSLRFQVAVKPDSGHMHSHYHDGWSPGAMERRDLDAKRSSSTAGPAHSVVAIEARKYHPPISATHGTGSCSRWSSLVQPSLLGPRSAQVDSPFVVGWARGPWGSSTRLMIAATADSSR